MKAEHVLYTDGHEVTVTDSMLQVKKKWYNLNGITKHSFSILEPDRIPSILLLVSGAGIEIVGAAELINSSMIADVYAGGKWFTANQLAMGLGVILMVIGALWLWFSKEKYAVSITTAEGERNVIVSEHKEYISQIVHALNEAFFARLGGPELGKSSRKREFIVSGR